MTRLLLLLLLLACSALAAEPPGFSFAVLTDIQYGDQPTAGKRDYRASPAKLREAVAALNQQPLEFVIQLGDLIDSQAADLDPILGIYNQLRAPHYHVLGNHDFAAPRDILLKRLTPAPYYRFTAPGWRFLVVDGMDLSVRDPTGAQMLQSLLKSGAPNAKEWDGALSPAQLAWLKTELDAAARARERAIVFCHFPVLAAASTPAHLLWNHAEVLQIIESHPAVAAWFAGHDHAGGYALRNGIHHVTFPGMVESGNLNSFSIVRVNSDRLQVQGSGTAPSRILRLR